MSGLRAILTIFIALIGFGLATDDGWAGKPVLFGGIKILPGSRNKQLPTSPVRHLECAVYPATQLSTLNLPVGSIGTPSMVVITNSLQATIPGGTTYTYTVAGKSYAATDADGVGPGGHFLIGFAANSQMPCDATIPG